jgi:hypothetical protein
VESEIRQVERELAEVERRARRGGAETRVRELSAVRDILYEDKWFRVATAVHAHLKRQFAEDAEAGELLEAAERRLYGLKLEVIEAPLLKIEAAVDRDGKIAAVRCRAALDVGVEAVYVGAAPGYKLKKTAQADKTAGAEAALTWRQVAASFPSSPKNPHRGAPAADKRPRDLQLWAASRRGLRFSMSRETPKLTTTASRSADRWGSTPAPPPSFLSSFLSALCAVGNIHANADAASRTAASAVRIFHLGPSLQTT